MDLFYASWHEKRNVKTSWDAGASRKTADLEKLKSEESARAGVIQGRLEEIG